MKNFVLASTVLVGMATAALVCGSAELAISSTVVAAVANIAAQTASEPDASMQDWTGVWKIITPGKPGGMLSIASDGGPNGTALSGVIVFYVMDRQTGERIALQARTMVNPGVENGKLVFEVRRILKPHLRDEPPASQHPLDPTDVAYMTLTRTGEGKAILTCPKCGSASSTELAKE